jgi:hypothetical protein
VDAKQASESSPPRAAPPARGRLSRTLAPARWAEYGRLLKAAIAADYLIVPLEEFLDGLAGDDERPVLILRHDVDQHSGSALTMSDVEVALGLRSTWYFRWRTASKPVIAEIRRRGGEVGLHYETLTRNARRGVSAEDDEGMEAAREELRSEIEVFADLFGKIRSVAAHGDTRVPGVRNADLLRGQEWSEFGIDYDANDAMRSHRLAAWVTDRSAAEGGWAEGVEPHALFRRGETPILCLTHPNNWVSGLSLWADRLSGTITGRNRDYPLSPDGEA